MPQPDARLPCGTAKDEAMEHAAVTALGRDVVGREVRRHHQWMTARCEDDQCALKPRCCPFLLQTRHRGRCIAHYNATHFVQRTYLHADCLNGANARAGKSWVW
jgi:hypothetical protein